MISKTHILIPLVIANFVQIAPAQLPEEWIKDRMVKRLPEIVELTVSGKVVETDTGELEPAPGEVLTGTAKRVVDQENQDRNELYRLIGMKATPKILDATEVGRLRAARRPKYGSTPNYSPPPVPPPHIPRQPTQHPGKAYVLSGRPMPNGGSIGIQFPTTIQFRSGSAELDWQAFDYIDRLSRFIRNSPNSISVRVVGYADGQGNSRLNYFLSRHRAVAVAGALAGRGIRVSRVEGRGERLPVGDNRSPVGRQLNRRVEIFLIHHTP